MARRAFEHDVYEDVFTATPAGGQGLPGREGRGNVFTEKLAGQAAGVSIMAANHVDRLSADRRPCAGGGVDEIDLQ